MTGVSPEQEAEILQALGEPEAEVAISLKETKARPKRTRKNVLEGLKLLPVEERVRMGPCPGGHYYFVDDVQEAVQLLNYWADHQAWAAIDLETSSSYRDVVDADGQFLRRWVKGSEPFSSLIFVASVSVKPGEAVVFDMRKLLPDPEFGEAFRRFLTQARLVTQGGIFEQSFFLVQLGVLANIVYDTLLGSQLIMAGIGKGGNDLGSQVKRTFGVELPKGWQQEWLQIHPTSFIPNEALAYAGGDVTYLLELAQLQQRQLEEAGMLHIWQEIEGPLMKWLALARVHGLEVNAEVFRTFDERLTELSQAREALFRQLCPGVLITSPQQLLAWFREQGVEIEGEPLKSTDEAHLLKVIASRGVTINPKDPRPFFTQVQEQEGDRVAQAAALVLDYRGVAKVRGTYVESYLDKHINPHTGRIHGFWNQIEADTGRMSCKDPSLMNIPSDGDYGRVRHAFIAQPGHLLGIADYSQMELRILAEESGEWKIIHTFQKAYKVQQELRAYCQQYDLPHDLDELQKDKPALYQELVQGHPEAHRMVMELANLDFHRVTAALIFGIPVEEVNKEQRAQAKTVNFAIPYGGEAFTISQQSGLPYKQADSLLKNYFRTFPAVARYLEKLAKQAVNRGWTATPAGRKRYYPQESRTEIYNRLRAQKQAALEAQAELDRYPDGQIPEGMAPKEWTKHKRELLTLVKNWEKMVTSWNSNDPASLADRLHRADQARTGRAGKNHPIQGANADITKLATILAGPRLQALHPECMVLMWIHDELVVTAPAELIEQATRILEEAMIEAGKKFLKQVPVAVSVSISPHWKK